MLSSTWVERLAPGIAQVTALNLRIHRKAIWDIVTVGGTRKRNFSTAPRPVSKSTPENVSPLSNSWSCRLKLRCLSLEKVVSWLIFPVSIPDARGTRAIIPTPSDHIHTRVPSSSRWIRCFLDSILNIYYLNVLIPPQSYWVGFNIQLRKGTPFSHWCKSIFSISIPVWEPYDGKIIH